MKLSWPDLRPKLNRAAYLKQAVLTGLGIVLAAGCLYLWQDHDASFLLLIVADGILVAACGRVIRAAATGLSAIASGFDGPFVIIGLALVLLLIPILACGSLIWSLIQSVRASPQGVASARD